MGRFFDNKKYDPSYCFLCGGPVSEAHHLIPGSANRKNCDDNDLIVGLCHSCHSRIHADGDLMRVMRIVGQLLYSLENVSKIATLSVLNVSPVGDYEFEETVDAFRRIFGKSFL